MSVFRKAINRFERWRAYRRALVAQRQIMALFDRYDCGVNLIDHMTGGRLSNAEARLNANIDRMKDLDAAWERMNA